MSLTLAHGYSLAAMLAVAAGAILLAGGFYYRAFGALPARQWRTLLLLRATAILLVVLLLFQPVLSYPSESVEKPAVIFLLDRSASMGIADGASGAARLAEAREKVAKWSARLERDFRVLPIAFAERAEPLAGSQDLPTLAPTGKATSLVRALQAAGKQVAPSEVAAVVLLSDGIHNASGNPVEAARRLGVVVHCVGVGASLRNNPTYRDIQVTGIDCPDRLLLGNVARVVGSIDAVGLGGRVVEVCLDEDSRRIGQTELTLDETEGSQQAAIDFRTTVKGRHTYTIRVAPMAEEKIIENNQRSAVANVAEAGIRVLYVEGTLRAEYGALVDRFLAKDPDLEFCALVQTRPNVFLARTNGGRPPPKAIPTDQAAIDRFDVFILGDIDSTYVRPAQQEMIVRRVRAGAGLVMLGGYHSLGPGGYAGTPLGNALPVALGDRGIGQVTDPFLPTLTPDGVRHPIFANIAEFFPTRQGEARMPGLPPLEGCTRVLGPRPGTTVLATFVGEASSMPVLAVQPLGQGRAAVFTGDTTRRWQQGSQALDRDSPFARFWGQMVRWLAGRAATVEAQAGVVAATDKAAYEPGEPIRISAVVRDKEGQAAAGAKVAAAVVGSGGQKVQLTLTAAGAASGHYAASIEPRMAGTYTIEVAARVGALDLKAEKIAVEVGRPNLEFERLDLDDELLANIAAATGGRYVSLASADRLIDQLDRSQRRKTVAIERPLSWPPGLWVLSVGLLTTEWILRRRYQLR